MMAIVALLLWMFTAGAGISLLARSNQSHAHSSQVPQEKAAAAETLAAGPQPASAAATPASATPASATPAAVSLAAAASPATSGVPPTKAEIRQATKTRFDPESLVASRSAPVVPGARALLEFMHPACAIVGLGFWLGFTLVHTRLLGWIAFGLITVTACLGLTWFAASSRAGRRQQGHGQDAQEPGGSGAPALTFSGRLAAIHGAAAAITFVLAALSALVLGA
jgi:hypothetical protein